MVGAWGSAVRVQAGGGPGVLPPSWGKFLEKVDSGSLVSLNRGREDAERALGREGAARMGCWVEAGSRP